MLPFGRIVVAFVAGLAARYRTAIGSLPHHRKALAGACPAYSRGIRLLPLRRLLNRASTPGASCEVHRFRATSPKSRSVLVVSHHLDGLLRTELVGLLHPTPDPGVRRVS